MAAPHWKYSALSAVLAWCLPLVGQPARAGDGRGGANSARPGAASPTSDDLDALLDMDIQQLRTVTVTPLETVVTTVSRQQSTIGHSPAAVFVITPEMIQRSGARSIPELLRMVPGVQVARIDANKWAVSARGFNDRFANKLLVQIDGRSVYTPLFGGVYWDVQNLLLEDVARIEVIRGPGATVWGANAVNGVINIITKSAKDTQGALITGGGGTEQRDFTALRYGGKLADNIYYRVYGLQFERDSGWSPDDHDFDDWRLGQGGFRLDWLPNTESTMTVQGDYYDGHIGSKHVVPTLAFPFSLVTKQDHHVAGANLLFRWTQTPQEQRNWALQVYFDNTKRYGALFDQEYNILDIDFQRALPVRPAHRVIWGLGYRLVDEFRRGDGQVIEVESENELEDVVSCFAQDTITLIEDRLFLTAGSKFEYNDYSGFELEPSGRLLWTLTPRRSAWIAVSRAVRVPTDLDKDLRITIAAIPPNSLLQLWGNEEIQAEDLLAFEAGYRAQRSSGFYYDVSVFQHFYDDLMVYSPQTPVPDPPIVRLPLVRTNGMRGKSCGVELAAQWDVSPCWQLRGAYTFLLIDLTPAVRVTSDAVDPEGKSPRNQVYLQSSWRLSPSLTIDLIGRYVDSLPALGVQRFLEADARLAWQPNANTEIAVIGRNLLDGRHPEFFSDVIGTEVQRGVYGMLTLKF